MNYQVVSLENTSKQELNFNYKYHEKYLNKIGEEIDHKFKTGVFKNFKLLVFEKDEQGKVKDADWIHEGDLVKI